MEISLADVVKVIRRFKNEIEFNRALFMVEMTYHIEGPKRAMIHARRIAAAYQNLRVSREMQMSL
jgi:hypothetical protein